MSAPDADRRSVTAVGAIMRRRFVALAPDDSLRDAEATMRMGRFRTLPVVSDAKLEGLLYYLPIVRWCFAEPAPGAPSVARRLAEGSVVALMDAKPACAVPEMPLGEAAARLADSRSGCLPVVDAAGRLLGLVTESDLLGAAYGGARS